MKNIYIMFHCDEWQTRSSERIAVASVNCNKVLKVLKSRIKEESISFDENTGKEGIKALKEFIKTKIDNSAKPTYDELRELNSLLTYGFINCVGDGEVL